MKGKRVIKLTDEQFQTLADVFDSAIEQFDYLGTTDQSELEEADHENRKDLDRFADLWDQIYKQTKENK